MSPSFQRWGPALSKAAILVKTRNTISKVESSLTLTLTLTLTLALAHPHFVPIPSLQCGLWPSPHLTPASPWHTLTRDDNNDDDATIAPSLRSSSRPCAVALALAFAHIRPGPCLPPQHDDGDATVRPGPRSSCDAMTTTSRPGALSRNRQSIPLTADAHVRSAQAHVGCHSLSLPPLKLGSTSTDSMLALHCGSDPAVDNEKGVVLTYRQMPKSSS